MRPEKRPQRDVFSPTNQNDFVYQPSRSSAASRQSLLMLPVLLSALSFAVVANARYDGAITLLHFNDLDGTAVQ